MTKYAPIGSVSSGAMRPEDLIPDFLYWLGQLDKAAHDALVEEYADVLDADGPDPEDDFCLEALFDALGNVAPPYCYFGALEGDGADYGFWISWDSVEEGCHDRAVVKVPAGDEWPELDADCGYVLEVNDHGNAALYSRSGEEIWSVV